MTMSIEEKRKIFPPEHACQRKPEENKPEPEPEPEPQPEPEPETPAEEE